ncbi:MAG: acyl-CoA synthetase [Rhodospirillales bacterium]|nr:acyl-CoA synthetase [Rhodospirillales bacterium]
MAKGKTKRSPPRRASQPRRDGGGKKWMVLAAIIMTVPFSLPTLLVMFVTMLPTLGAVMAERGRHRYAWLCVGGLNFCGIAPFLFQLWFGTHSLEKALAMISQVPMLLIAYGCAALGWGLFMAVPPVVGAFMALGAGRRAQVLRQEQKKLLEEWGDDVAKVIEDED